MAAKKLQKLSIFLLLFSAATLTLKTSFAAWEKIPPNNNFLTSVETTPWGLLIGEFDGRIWMTPPPLNDIYLSRDLGQTWAPLGLTGRGVKDIKFYNGKIYVITHYVINGLAGPFVSDDMGKTWERTGPSFANAKINRDSKTIYYGTEQNGLWISQDEGITWIQKIGPNVSSLLIKGLESTEKVTYATTLDKVYRTYDQGNSWEEVTPLNNKGIIHFIIEGNLIFAGSSGIAGLYRSTDSGITWEKVQSFGNYAVGGLDYYENVLYAGRYNPAIGLYTVYKSNDLGISWEDTFLNVPNSKYVADLTWTFSSFSNLYAISSNNGVYKYQIPKNTPDIFPFLEIPWKNGEPGELIDNITSFFDHEYPFLGYGYFSESGSTNSTTLNFYGEKQPKPKLYYSSHNGVDYALNYGSEITAPAEGLASYYYCTGCGNSIRITHPNGYQSIYMHLQKNGLITSENQVSVSTGDTIGKIGMTGNTNGPHLHFQINRNGLFPDGLVDPYGWLNLKTHDPWPLFSWQDALGNHNGTKSYYLWNHQPSAISSLIIGSGSLTLDNKTISWKQTPADSQTVFIKNYFQPAIPESQNKLAYVSNTSILLNAYDFLGQEVSGFSEPVEIKIDFSETDISKFIAETIKIYFLNEISDLWEPIPTVLDLVAKVATGETYHLSQFALLGEKADSSPPVTQIIISGSVDGNWYTEYPSVEFSVTDSEGSPTTIFYSLEGEAGWEEYSNPFIVTKEGIVNIEYRSMDEKGNIEKTQSYVLQIYTKGRGKKTVRVKETEFTIL